MNLAQTIDLNPLYAELDLKPGAGLPEVKSAYRRLAKALHPDRNPESSGSLMARVNRAYRRLLAALTGGQEKADQKADDWELEGIYISGPALIYQISLSGRPQNITLPLRQRRRCDRCQGKGLLREGRCPLCAGRGYTSRCDWLHIAPPADWPLGRRIAVNHPRALEPMFLERVAGEA